MLIKTKSLS